MADKKDMKKTSRVQQAEKSKKGFTRPLSTCFQKRDSKKRK